MNSNAKSKVIILLAFGTLFALSPVITTNLSFTTGNTNKNSEYSDDISLDNKNLKISAISGKIHIINNSGWVAFKNAGNCTGEGTYSEPYVIEDLEIDGGGSGSCILIENSTAYFRIENCSVSDSHEGIMLSNVSNSQLIDNYCSSIRRGIYLRNSNNNNLSGNIAYDNDFCIYLIYSNNNTVSENTVNLGSNGIDLFSCNNNTISGNTLNHNYFRGIHLFSCNNNTISGNTLNNNWFGIYIVGDNNDITGNFLNYNHYGIYLYNSNNISLSGNIMNECGLALSGSIEDLRSYCIDTTNLVNDKPLYYYANEVNLDSSNFTNAGQVLLVNCNDSLISNLDVSYCTNYYYYCNYNNISGNTANLGVYGIYLSNSNYNNISGNTANLGVYGIYLSNSNYNNISGNTANNNSERGIQLSSSDYNTISGNTANNNKDTGIYLYRSNYNTVSGNTLLGNDECIVEINCKGNTFSDNGSCTYGQTEDIIQGYNLFFILGILSVIAIIRSKKLKKA